MNFKAYPHAGGVGSIDATKRHADVSQATRFDFYFSDAKERGPHSPIRRLALIEN
jgi:hypothetical protein